MRYHCRCRKCRARQVLHHPPDSYLSPPTCRICGEPALRLDRWMNQRDTHAMSCTCQGSATGYPFPHRRGSRWCNYHADGSWKTDEEFLALYQSLEDEPHYELEELD